jgi:hypothetical protein
MEKRRIGSRMTLKERMKNNYEFRFMNEELREREKKGFKDEIREEE